MALSAYVTTKRTFEGFFGGGGGFLLVSLVLAYLLGLKACDLACASYAVSYGVCINSAYLETYRGYTCINYSFPPIRTYVVINSSILPLPPRASQGICSRRRSLHMLKQPNQSVSLVRLLLYHIHTSQADIYTFPCPGTPCYQKQLLLTCMFENGTLSALRYHQTNPYISSEPFS